MQFSNNSAKSIGSRLEKAVADFLGWKVVSGSGARDLNPGDLVADNWMGECKTHTSPSSTITFYRSHWDKICEEAHSHFKYPVLFCDNGTQKADKTWCVCKAISVEGSHFQDIGVKVKKNLIVAPSNLNSESVYSFKFGDQVCVLCSLLKFADIAQGVS